MAQASLSSPRILFENQVNVLLAGLPAARDADIEGVHSARVATRRLRETLPLFLRAHPRDVDRITQLVKRAGRRLGRVRDLDVMEEDLARRAKRLPSALHAIGVARVVLNRQRTKARRRLVRALDRLALDGAEALRLSRVRHAWSVFGRDAGGWDRVLRHRIGHRAGEPRAAIDHASAVYSPNSLHRVRIAAKKLRYSVELAQQSGLSSDLHVLGDLKRGQESLGRLHDAQVLLETTDALVTESGVDAGQVRLLKEDLEGEIAERHMEYLARRERLREVCSVCECFAALPAARQFFARPLLAAGVAAALPAGLLLLGARGHRRLVPN
jgi:CHAD domain-containing protein